MEGEEAREEDEKRVITLEEVIRLIALDEEETRGVEEKEV